MWIMTTSGESQAASGCIGNRLRFTVYGLQLIKTAPLSAQEITQKSLKNRPSCHFERQREIFTIRFLVTIVPRNDSGEKVWNNEIYYLVPWNEI